MPLSFQSHSTIPLCNVLWSYNPSPKTGLGFSNFARHYFRNHFCFLLLQVLRCFNSLSCPPTGYVLACGWCASFHIGFPHSDTPGSLSTYDSPRLFAVCCVLLPLYMPRHSPYALFHLIILAIKSRSLMVFFYFFKNCCFTICLFYLLHDLEIFFLFTTLFGKTFNIFLSVSFFSIIQFSKNERLSLEKSSRSLKTKQKSYSKLLFTCVFLSP